MTTWESSAKMSGLNDLDDLNRLRHRHPFWTQQLTNRAGVLSLKVTQSCAGDKLPLGENAQPDTGGMMSALGQKQTLTLTSDDARFTSESRN